MDPGEVFLSQFFTQIRICEGGKLGEKMSCEKIVGFEEEVIF